MPGDKRWYDLRGMSRVPVGSEVDGSAVDDGLLAFDEDEITLGGLLRIADAVERVAAAADRIAAALPDDKPPAAELAKESRERAFLAYLKAGRPEAVEYLSIDVENLPIPEEVADRLVDAEVFDLGDLIFAGPSQIPDWPGVTYGESVARLARVLASYGFEFDNDAFDYYLSGAGRHG